MATRFEPNRRLLHILVGSNLYDSPNAAIRELIQNAWDAIQWRQQHGDGEGSSIQIRYSIEQRWFEVVDDGYGMDEETIRNSFLAIGEDKLKVLGTDSRENQIGYFGIGVLSIFLVSNRIEITTRRVGSSSHAIYFKITGLDDPIEFEQSTEDRYGTKIRVYISTDGNFNTEDIPTIVQNYARHVSGVVVHNVDTGTSRPVADTWKLADGDVVGTTSDFHGIRSGQFAFSSALTEHSGTLSTDITICNAGFLVEENVYDLLPTHTLGLIGEIDLAPHSLTMGMSRERIQRDELWLALGRSLQERAISLALGELTEGVFSRRGNALDNPKTKRALLLWYHFFSSEPSLSELYDEIDKRIFETVPFSLPERADSSLTRIVGAGTEGAKLFFRQVYQPQERTQNIDDEGMPIRVSEEIRDSIRIGALRARGFEVIELDRQQVNIRRRGTVRTQQLEEYPLVQKCLQRRRIQLVDIAHATESDMDLRSIERLPILKDALNIGGGLRFAHIPDSKRRIVTDRSGVKYINLNHPNVQKLLEIIPQATSNPLKSKILDAYLKLEDYKLRDTRIALIDLLETSDLEVLASANVAPLSEKYIRTFVEELLSEMRS